jgi:DNA-binding LacI/PurR family transcriptional regulator
MRFGIVFASDPSRGLLGLGGWNRFWDHLAKAAPIVEREFGVELPVFYSVVDKQSPGHAALVSAIRRQTVGGLIIVGTPSLLHMPEITAFTLPKVTIFDGAEGLAVGCPQLYFDFDSFVTRSLSLLKDRGCSRVACFHVPYDAHNSEVEAMRRRGIVATQANEPIDQRYAKAMARDGHWRSPSHWHFMVGPSGVSNVVRLLLDHSPAERPDSLIVSDDNLVPAVLSGVIAAGIRVPDELQVLTHVNWPVFTADVVPVQRLGFDVPSLLRRCVETIARVREGDPVPAMQRLPAMLEAEVMQLAGQAQPSVGSVPAT